MSRKKRPSKARRNKTAKRISRPNLISLAGQEHKLKGGKLEFGGHVFNSVQVQVLQEKVQERLGIASRPNSNIPYPGTYARDTGLKDLLWKYRPSVCAEEELLEVSNALSMSAITIGTLRSFHFYQDGAARQQGAELLRQMAEEAGRHVAKLLHLAESIKLEESTKLQDWTARWEEYDRI